MQKNDLRNQFADWLRRTMAGQRTPEGGRWTQISLAKAAGVSRDTLWRLLNAKTDVELGTVKRLASALGVPEPRLGMTDGAALSPLKPLAGKSVDAIYFEAVQDIAGWALADPAYQIPAARATIWLNEMKQAIARDRDDVVRVLKREIAELHEQLAKQAPGARRASGSAD